ncbi:uncharacterized protein METZ01_LOCUS111562 [marine metagenome]|uniref:Uncharacterized protein n=1 Tax=marine metagenome TaxID=408172 RepID=A0A381X2C8_9ZZZZ
MKQEIIKEKFSYAMLIIDLSEEIRIPIKETKKIVDTAISIIKPSKIDYNKLKEEILAFVVINIFSLICKL